MNISSVRFKIDAPLPLPENEVQLWRADLDAICTEESRWQRVLSPDEQKRASRFHFPGDRQRFAAARALLRIILAGYLNVEPLSVNFCYSAKEKPSLAPSHAASNITFNLSHSGGIALYAFARRLELGVDVEKIGRDFDVEGIARRFFSAHEQEQLAELPAAERDEAFFRCWTRKEAYIKATGDGLSLPLSQFDVSLQPGSSDALVATRPDGAEAGNWLLREVPAGAGYVAALCVRGRNWKLAGWNEE
ncbi:MAG: 4'-phosphopantetheinyl transferase superfamily protein [Candidatus Sulfotelmatobacter sp.]|jgi:4'-phosphopantetheinyl transferase